MLNKKALNMLDFISPLNEGPNILHSAAILVKDIIEVSKGQLLPIINSRRIKAKIVNNAIPASLSLSLLFS